MKNSKLNRKQAIEALSREYGIDLFKCANGIRVKVIDHEENALAPERYCYKITFDLFGAKHKLGFWPNTVGYQSY
jgi:hypothetical protein